ncbi:DUF6229 family protein [Dyella silvatica]|nr:DUF6229 family protein [Dyella silvatica]
MQQTDDIVSDWLGGPDSIDGMKNCAFFVDGLRAVSCTAL